MADAAGGSKPDDTKAEAADAEAKPVAGTLLVCGATDFHAVGRSKDVREEYPSLPVPHRLKALEGIKISFIAAGSAACHSLIVSDAGAAYTWGRNEKGQLGLGDTTNRNVPTLVPGLAGRAVAHGSCGKAHTAVACADGTAWAWGLNASGQCGTGSCKPAKKGSEDVLTAPAQSLVSRAARAECGAEFTVWLDAGGKLWSAGLPQYGQLGHGDDCQYNAADSSVKMVFDPQPTPKVVAALAEKRVTRVACGHNHTVAVASDGGVWTWGFGGYGRLGHRVQQDEFRPRLVETLTGRITVPADAVVAAGSTATFCSTVGGQLFAWGKLKASGDNLMYPTPYHELAGWTITSLACGATTFAAAAHYGAERSTITWGHSGGYFELGYGPGKKSSASPDKCMALEGARTYQVAMGVGHSLFLCEPDHPKVLAAPVWAPPSDKDETAPVPQAPGKRKPAGAAAKGKGPAAKKAK